MDRVVAVLGENKVKGINRSGKTFGTGKCKTKHQEETYRQRW